MFLLFLSHPVPNTTAANNILTFFFRVKKDSNFKFMNCLLGDSHGMLSLTCIFSDKHIFRMLSARSLHGALTIYTTNCHYIDNMINCELKSRTVL